MTNDEFELGRSESGNPLAGRRRSSFALLLIILRLAAEPAEDVADPAAIFAVSADQARFDLPFEELLKNVPRIDLGIDCRAFQHDRNAIREDLDQVAAKALIARDKLGQQLRRKRYGDLLLQIAELHVAVKSEIHRLWLHAGLS